MKDKLQPTTLFSRAQLCNWTPSPFLPLECLLNVSLLWLSLPLTDGKGQTDCGACALGMAYRCLKLIMSKPELITFSHHTSSSLYSYLSQRHYDPPTRLSKPRPISHLHKSLSSPSQLVNIYSSFKIAWASPPPRNL